MRVHDMPQMNSTDRFSTSIADEKDRSRCFNHRNELRIDRSWHAYAYAYCMHECYIIIVSIRAINIALASFIYTRLFIYMDYSYVSQRNARSRTSSTCQRK